MNHNIINAKNNVGFELYCLAVCHITEFPECAHEDDIEPRK